MSLNDDLTAVQRSLDDLDRSLGMLEKDLDPGGLDMRRVRTDASHLRESFALLRGTRPAERPAPEKVTIPDTPYDRSLWSDAEDDEGLGARDRRAP
ncbi:hypothetical protein ACFY41_20050 [Streptomyces syringium]|uniref:Uncharacterized protein n=1 Tax=Streptomyces syringium TaxID=76729 RepID=A0ABS4Y7Y9_9ACTN|nr:hypothetical protein [Streptomyces syringium]MBP2404906.1 hypothetical protein [Streptomyces syringium]SPE57882.1 hypothetical protein SNS2_3531 [Streptomyces netropsis]